MTLRSMDTSLAAGLTLAPLVVNVDPNLNVILTACLTVYVGCYRSVKPTPPSVRTIIQIHVFLFLCLIASLNVNMFIHAGDNV